MNTRQLKIATIKSLLEEISKGECKCTDRHLGTPYVYDYTALERHFEWCPRKKAILTLDLIKSIEL